MAADLGELERLEIRVALEDLNTAFCYHLDHNEVDALIDLFADDVYYTHGSRVSHGKAELAKVFRGRSTTQVRTSRHMYSGLRLEIDDGSIATSYFIASDRETMEFKFIPTSPDSTSPTDTTWKIVRWSEVAN